MTTTSFPTRDLPSFGHVLAYRAAVSPDRLALSFRDPEGELTYARLHRRAAALAARLAEVTSPGERAVLLLPPGLDYVTAFFGCLYAGVIAVPTYPPLDQRQVPRLMSVLADAEPSVVLTLPALVDFARDSLADNGFDRPMTWLGLDDGETDGAPLPAGPDTTAFLQYTSGSTSAPKGTVVTHANLLDNSEAIRVLFGHSEDSRGVIWLPPYHDMGLIGGILQPVYAGFPVRLMSPFDFLADPGTWLAEISDFGATTSGGPNFAFDLCVRKIGPDRRATFDLSSWAVAFCGAEPIRAATFERFVAAFAPHGFRESALYPCYGLAETTLIAAGGTRGAGYHHCPAPPAQLSSAPPISCGPPTPGHHIEIRRPGTADVLADGEVGEICVRGPSVAAGYWNAPVATAAAFQDGPDFPTLRTGDLGFLRDGELYVTGRLKDVVIVRGRNLAAEDVEHHATGAHPAVRPGAVAAFEVVVRGEPALAVLAEVTDAAAREDVAAAVRAALVESLGVRPEVVLLAPRGTIPKTPSGKIRRSECRRRYEEGELSLLGTYSATTATGPATEPVAEGASRIAELAATILGRPAGAVPLTTSLTALGLDSVRAVELRHAARAELGVTLSLRALLTGATATDLAANAQAPAAARAAAVDPGALSDGERGLWLASRLTGDPADHVVSAAVDLVGAVDVDVLTRAVEQLAERHPALRTRFPDQGGEPRRAPGPPAALHVVPAATDEEVDGLVRAAGNRLPELATGPLWQVTLVHRPESAVLVVCVHHMVCDVWSFDVLIAELGSVYAALSRGTHPALPPAGDPAVLAARQADRLAGAEGHRLREHWRQALADLPPSAALPRARRSGRPAPAGRRQATLSAGTAAAVRGLAEQTGVTPYAVLLTALAWTVYRHTSEPRFVVGVPAPGRLDPDAVRTVGYLTNPLPVVCAVDEHEDFRAHVRATAEAVAAAQDHQDLPYQRIVAELVPRDRRGDLLRIVVAQQQAPLGHAPALLGAAPRRVGDLVAKTRFVRQHTAPFELTVELAASDDGFGVTLIHDTAALTGADVAAFAAHWTRVLTQASAEPAVRPGDVAMLTEAEHQALARMACRSLSLPPAAHTLPAAVLAAAERVPAAVAVADADGTLTYRELVTRASALASELRARGAGADEPVAVLLPRGRDLVIAMLAAQLAGSPYLPLEVSHPRARRAAILADARPVVTVTDAAHATADTVLVDAPRPGASAPTPPAHPDTLAHLIYTSGSTGTPKGVACTHRAVLNLLANHASFAPVAAGDVVGWWTSPGFDVSVLEVFSALVAGATVAVCPDPARLDAAGVLDWLARAGVTHAYLPPHLLHPVAELLTAGRPGLRLRHLLVGVEPIPAALLRRLMRLVPGLRVVNGYGPTEATVCATFHAVDPADVADGPVPLGIGLANCPAHVFDRHGRPAPIGSVGELYLGGVGLARGYHRGPGRTAERFVPDPFRPGGRLYRTGDLARREPDGTLVFVGRVDDQVKVRGMRVEPAEVAAAMTAHPGVASSVVVADGVPPDVRLVGYVVAEPTSGPDLAGEVLRDLRGRLPGPMVPSAVVLVDEWPTTVNGKVDRAALPAPRRARATGAPPVGPVEIVIAEVWAELLEVPDVSRTDDFFELGGHSLLATRACAGIAARLGVSVEPAHLVNHPTVAGLGAALAAPPAERDEPDLALVLAEHVADLPEELLRELDEEGLS